MNANVSLGRIAGIQVGFNWSLLVVATLIAWSLATSLLPSAAPGQTTGAYWAAGVISAFVFLTSLLAHELAHVVQYERLSGIEGFLKPYLEEVEIYPNGPMEREANSLLLKGCRDSIRNLNLLLFIDLNLWLPFVELYLADDADFFALK